MTFDAQNTPPGCRGSDLPAEHPLPGVDAHADTYSARRSPPTHFPTTVAAWRVGAVVEGFLQTSDEADEASAEAEANRLLQLGYRYAIHYQVQIVDDGPTT